MSGASSQNGGITQFLIPSKTVYLCIVHFKIYVMRLNANLSNSIYQQKKAGPGLSMECGMMINNRPDSVTGIQRAVDMKKFTKRMEKVSYLSEAMSISQMGSCGCKG
jgi:hypothetical protein